MSLIVITSYGTLGDYLPYIALGKVLKSRGHQVRMVVNKSIYPYVLKAGLEPFPIGRPNMGPQEVRLHAHKWNHLPMLRGDRKKFMDIGFDYDMNESLDSLLNACDGAEMVISCLLQDRVTALVGDILDICHVRSSVTPFPLCFPKPEYEIIYPESWRHTKDFSRFILSGSPYFCELLPEYSQVHQTGFWFYEHPDWNSWQPSPELREFVEQEPKPLVLSYSSVPVENPQEVVEVHVRAAAKLGRRILIHQGWAGFNESHLPSDIKRDHVMFLDGLIPQDWLFPRAAALITHGGVGTVARALRNGCPMLVEPLGNDQFYNALRVIKLGVGAAMDSQKLTVDGIANILQKKVLTPNTKKRAVEVGEKIKAEQGLIKACDLIEGWLPKAGCESTLNPTVSKKINLSNTTTQDFHRSGWNFAVNALKPLDSFRGIYFDDFIEKNFSWKHRRTGPKRSDVVLEVLKKHGVYDWLATSEEKGITPYTKPWVGILHNPQNMPTWFFYHNSPQTIFAKEIWKKSLDYCVGLFAFSEYQAEWLRTQTGKPVSTLIHPTEIPELQFDFDNFQKNSEKKIVQVGWWLRKLHGIYQLPIPQNNSLKYEKIRLVPTYSPAAEQEINDLMRIEKEMEQLQIEEDYSKNTTEIVQIPNKEYDELLSENIVFIELYDSSANNAVVECIARATPILVNPLPAVVEYLGKDYPFYFNSLSEAAEKALDTSLILETHNYLKTCETRSKLSAEYFLKSFQESEVYQLIEIK